MVKSARRVKSNPTAGCRYRPLNFLSGLSLIGFLTNQRDKCILLDKVYSRYILKSNEKENYCFIIFYKLNVFFISRIYVNKPFET